MSSEKSTVIVASPSRQRRWASMLLVAVLAVGIIFNASTRDQAAAAVQTSGGWTTKATSSPSTVAPGSTVTVTVTVTSATTRRALVDLEVYSATGRVYQHAWDGQSFTAGKTRTFSIAWPIPASEATGTHTVRVGIFGAGWGPLQHWNNTAGQFAVTATTTTVPPTTTTTTTVPPTTTTTTVPPTTTTVPPTTTTTPPPTTTTTPPPTGRFTTSPVGAALPSDADCASRVRRTATEIRPGNTSYNQTTGNATSSASGPLFARVTGSFTGTTDEILQWGACKWGLDEDIVRAQTAKESWWQQTAVGDFTTDASRCAPGHPIGADGAAGQCPESIGLLQIRYPYADAAFPAAGTSSSYNVDYTLAAWRSCYEGQQTWLNQFERGRDYAAGDAWGCVGLWFAGRWYTQPANDYVAAVQSYLAQRIWETAGFKG